MYELCRYLLASGRRCTQPAVTGGPYCRHHGVVRRTVASSIVPPQFHHLHRALPFLYPEDRASIQANCFLVMRALDDRRISSQTANAYNRLLRTCQANLKPGPLHESDSNSKSDGGPLKRSLSGEQNEQKSLSQEENIVRRVVLTPAGEELAPTFEVWEEGEGQHPRAAAREPHHPDCRCAQCPKPDQLETVEEQERPSPTDVILSDVDADRRQQVEGPAFRSSVSGQGFSPADTTDGEQDTPFSIEDDEPYAYYEGDPVPPDPYAAKETEEEREQNRERREQILDKHKDRLAKVEKQYLYTPQLADRIRDEIQHIMELEMGHEAFSYQLLPPPAS